MENSQIKNTNREKNYSIPNIEKNGELCLFYNIAYNRMSKFIANYENKENFEIRDIAGYFHNNFNKTSEQVLKPKAYLQIYERILDERTGGNTLINAEKINLVNSVLLLLWRLRDYYSHYYHQDVKAQIPREIKDWLLQKLKIAQEKYPEKNRKKLEFKIIEETSFTTRDDKTINVFSLTSKTEKEKLLAQGTEFFLSFFLPRSYMNEFLNLREGYKRTFNSEKDEIDYIYFRYLCTFYSKKDANRQNILTEKGKISSLTQNDYLQITLQSYLNSVPDFIFPNLKNDYINETPQKNRNTFLQLAINYIILNVEEENRKLIEWEVVNKNLVLESEERELKIKGKPQTIISDKKVRKFKSYFESEYDQLAVKNGNIRLRINNIHQQQGKFVEVLMHEREVISLLYLLLNDKQKFNKAINDLVSFSNQYVAFLKDALQNKVKEIDNYKLLKKYLFATDINIKLGEEEKTIKTPTLNKVFQQFFENNEIDFDDFKNTVLQKIITTKEKITEMKSKKDEFSFLNIDTSVYETPEAIKGFIDIKPKKDWTVEEKDQLKDWLKQKAKLKNIRYKKMQLVLYCKKIILGKSGKFISENERKSFMAYCYLLDKKDTDRSFLINDFTIRLKGKEVREHLRNYNTDYLDILKNAESFDDFVIKSFDLAIDRLQDWENNFSKTNDEFIKVISKILDIPYPSISESRNEEKANSYYINRKQEILSAYIDNVKNAESFLLNLPKRFFNNYEDDIKITEKIKLEDAYQKYLKIWKNKSEESYTSYFDDFKKILVNGNKEDIKNAKKLNYELIKQTLADKMLHTSWLGEQTKNWKFTEKQEVKYKYKEVEITAPLRELRAYNTLFEEDRFNKILDRLIVENNEQKTFSLNEIKLALLKHYRESRNFISKTLVLDKVYTDKFLLNYKENSKKPYKFYDLVKPELAYVKMYKDDSKNNQQELDYSINLEVLEISNEAWSKICEYRNKAFHLDVLPVEKNYENLTEKIETLITKINSLKNQ